MPATYEPIATTTLSTATNTITFDSISSAYTDLRLILVALGNGTNGWSFKYNNDSSALYSFNTFYGAGNTKGASSAVSQASINPLFFIGILNSTLPSLFLVDIFNYANTTSNKTCLISSNLDANGAGSLSNTVALYRSNSAISRIDLSASPSTNFSIGTTATLYGILKA